MFTISLGKINKGVVNPLTLERMAEMALDEKNLTMYENTFMETFIHVFSHWRSIRAQESSCYGLP